MKPYQGKYQPQSQEPYKLSRSKIENFIRCRRCFYLDRRLGIKIPQGPPFNINIAVDALLKKEFDVHRRAANAHPLMIEANIDAVPFLHDNMDQWRENFYGVQTLHDATNLLVFGAVDDIWQSPNQELIVVDYKATAKKGEVSLDAEWQMSYKRQMEIYQWLLRANGFSVSDTGYFVYANGRLDRPGFNERVEFNISVLPYTGDDSWIEDILLQIHAVLNAETIPDPSETCEYCAYFYQRATVDYQSTA